MTIDINGSLAEQLRSADSRREMTDILFEFMARHGQSTYDESVTQLEHALQAATLARQSGAEAELVVGALLHDIGHFLTEETDGDFQQEDWEHERIGAEQLRPFVGDAVLEAIRLHVPAKRYLCTVDDDYYRGLSPASQRSYQLQGGQMSDDERAAFEAIPHYQAAVQVRRWDDGAKVSGLQTPGLEDFREEVESCLLMASPSP